MKKSRMLTAALVAAVGLLLLVTGLMAVWPRYEMFSYGHVALPGGGTGDMFVFFVDGAWRDLVIEYRKDDNAGAILATAPAWDRGCLIVTVPEDHSEIRVFHWPTVQTTPMLSPSSSKDGLGWGGHDAAIPSLNPLSSRMYKFFERSFVRPAPGGKQAKEGTHSLWIGYR